MFLKSFQNGSPVFLRYKLSSLENTNGIQDESYSEEDTHNHDKICISLDKMKKFYYEKTNMMMLNG